MRAVSHCFAHPSHEASLRCTSCGRWVCDRCANQWGDRVYCSRWCQAVAGARRLPAKALQQFRSHIGVHWSIAMVASAAALLLSVAGSHLAVLLREAAETSPNGAVSEEVSVPVSGRLALEEGGWRLDLKGPSHGRVLVLRDGMPALEVTLDGDGAGSLSGLGMSASTATVRVMSIDHPPVVIQGATDPAATASTSPSPSPSPSATHTPIRPPSDTEAPLAIVPPKPTPVATPRILPREDRLVARAAPPVLHLVTDCGPRIAITFDGADSSAGTADLLDVLENIDLQGTLFVTGEFIDANPGLVRHALLAGHEFGNHTYSHEHLTSYASNRRHDLLAHVTRTWLHDELRRTEEAFFRATGRTMTPLWRAPYGEENALLRGWAMELGYLHVRWSSLEGASLDSLDWVSDEHSALYRDPSRMVDRLLRFPRLEGGIVLMHLSSERAQPPWNQLPRFLAALRSRGLQPVTLTEMLASSKTWRPWLERAAARKQAAHAR